MDDFTINVSREVEALEHTLRAPEYPLRRLEALAILRRWQFDTMLDEASRHKAALLVNEFSGHTPPHSLR